MGLKKHPGVWTEDEVSFNRIRHAGEDQKKN